MVRCGMILQAAAAAFACMSLIDFSSAFSFTPQLSKQGTRSSQLSMLDDDGEATDEAHINTIKSRREFFSKIAATAPILFTATQASAVTNEPTRIELVVDTEYLIRVLNYFDGDMRKVLGVLVRSPQTTVEIEPPPKGNDPKLTPENAILRALYSFSSPEDYVTQASWLKVDEPDKGWVDFLTKKRYRIYLPSIGSDGNEESGKKLEVVIRPTNINLSNLEAGVGLGILSYPLAYSYYNYESYKEEQEKIAKKAKMAAKKAAKAKASAAKKSKGTPKKETAVVKADGGNKQKPAMKGQEMKKGGLDNKPLPTKKVTTVAKDIESTRPAEDSVEDQNAAEMLDSQRTQFIAATEQEKTSQLETQPGQDINELEQLVAAAAAAAGAKNPSESLKPTGGGYLDNLSQPAAATGYLDDQSLNFSESAQSGSSPNTGTNLRSLAENMKPERGSSNSYLDSL